MHLRLHLTTRSPSSCELRSPIPDPRSPIPDLRSPISAQALEDTFTTRSGREVTLRIYTQAHNADKTAFAMQSLKNSMTWDEERFGLEYDLSLFNIVAVDDFNMGAMENKSLNVFNSSLILASPETATDGDYCAIEGVIGRAGPVLPRLALRVALLWSALSCIVWPAAVRFALRPHLIIGFASSPLLHLSARHEYFHNWTGDRVTCRDWFQLSLKEGLTVYRDQEFSSDLNSRPVKRIEARGPGIAQRAAGCSRVLLPTAAPQLHGSHPLFRSNPPGRRTCACCALGSSRRTAAQWRTRSGRRRTRRSPTSTPCATRMR